MELILRDPAIPDVADVHSFNQGQAHALAAMRAVCVEKIALIYGLTSRQWELRAIADAKKESFQFIIDLIDGTKEHHGN